MAYGTDIDKMSNGDLDDIMVPDFEWKKYRLRKATRFCISRIVDFPVNPRWFDFSKRRPFGTIPGDLFNPFYVKLTRRVFHGQSIQHVVSRAGAQPAAAKVELDLLSDRAVMKCGSFSMEFFFDEEPSEVLDAVGGAEFLTSEEKAAAIGALRAQPTESAPVIQRPRRRETRREDWI